MPKLYIGAPMTMTSAAFNSATNSSDSANNAGNQVADSPGSQTESNSHSD